MTTFGALLTLFVEVLRLVRGSGGVSNAVATLKQVNDTFDKVDKAETPKEYQDAAKAISDLESNSTD